MDRTSTTWTCDRCGIESEQKQGDPPTGWSRITMVNPPRAEYQPDKYDHRKADLCRDCTRAVRIHSFERMPVAVEAGGPR